jgi:hypothetical protein
LSLSIIEHRLVEDQQVQQIQKLVRSLLQPPQHGTTAYAGIDASPTGGAIRKT